MATEKIQYDVKVTGTQQASQGFKTVAGSIDKAKTASVGFTSQVSGANTAVGGLVTALSAADPRIAQFTFALGGARAALTGLVTMLGGPMGLIAGAAAGGAIAAVAMFTRSQKESEEQIKRTTDAMNAQVRAIRDFAKAAASEFGPRSPESERIDQKIIEMESQRRMALRRGDVTTAHGLRQTIADATEAREQARAAEANARDLKQFDMELTAAGGMPAERKRGKGPQAGSFAHGGSQTSVDESRFLDLDKALAADEAEAARQEEALAKERVAIRKAVFKEQYEYEQEQIKENLKLKEEAAQRELEIIEKNVEAQRQSFINIGEFATQSFGKGFSALAKGQKFAAAAALEGIGDMMVAEGTHMLFKAAIAAIIPGMQLQSGPLAAIGAAEIAAGMALGAAGAGAAPSGGGGGGLGTARPVTSVDTSQDTRPIIINLNNSIGPSTELGVVTSESQVMARQVLGDYASR